MLHDIGMAVDYDDHHKHSRYLILNAGLPGFTPREVALIGQAARYHRKGTPTSASSRRSRATATRSCWSAARAVLRLAEQLERSRDQTVARGSRRRDRRQRAPCGSRPTRTSRVARWAAEREGDVFERAFGRELEVSD